MTLEVFRVGAHEFIGRNDRGGAVHIGRSGQENSLSPSELLQIAVAGCAVVTAENLITRRIGADTKLRVEVTNTRNPTAEELDAINVNFDIDLSTLDETQQLALAEATDRAIARLCTVSRTLKKGIPVTTNLPVVRSD